MPQGDSALQSAEGLHYLPPEIWDVIFGKADWKACLDLGKFSLARSKLKAIEANAEQESCIRTTVGEGRVQHLNFLLTFLQSADGKPCRRQSAIQLKMMLCAALWGQLEVLKFLIAKKMSAPKIIDSMNFAAGNGQTEYLQWLLDGENQRQWLVPGSPDYRNLCEQLQVRSRAAARNAAKSKSPESAFIILKHCARSLNSEEDHISFNCDLFQAIWESLPAPRAVELLGWLIWNDHLHLVGCFTKVAAHSGVWIEGAMCMAIMTAKGRIIGMCREQYLSHDRPNIGHVTLESGEKMEAKVWLQHRHNSRITSFMVDKDMPYRLPRAILSPPLQVVHLRTLGRASSISIKAATEKLLAAGNAVFGRE